MVLILITRHIEFGIASMRAPANRELLDNKDNTIGYDRLKA